MLSQDFRMMQGEVSNTSQSNLTRLAKWSFLSTKTWLATCLFLVEPLTPKMVNLHITFKQTNCSDLRCCVSSFFVHDAFLETYTEGEKRMPKMEYHWYKGFFLKSWCYKEVSLSAYPICSLRNVSTGLWPRFLGKWKNHQPKTLKSEREYPGTTCFLGWPSLWHIVFVLCLYHVSKFGSRK